MKPSLWITACCLNLAAFPSLAQETASPQAAAPGQAPTVQGDVPATAPTSQHPCADRYRPLHQPDAGYYPPHRHRRPDYQTGREYAAPYPYDNRYPGYGQGEAYGNERGYGHPPPRAYSAPYGYDSAPGYGYAPPGQGMGPGYGEVPEYGYENPPLPAEEYYPHPGYGRGAYAPSDYPRGYALPYGDAGQQPVYPDRRFDSGGFDRAPMEPAQPHPPARGFEQGYGAEPPMPMNYAPLPPVSAPGPEQVELTPPAAAAGSPTEASQPPANNPTTTTPAQAEAAAQDSPPLPEPQAATDKQQD